jgi:D-alanyl-D-alanine carboxypeptidase
MASNGRLPASALAPIAGGQLEHKAAAAWNAMNVEARRNGVELRPTGSRSSYRTYADQQFFWNEYQAGRGNLAARPGTSNHGLGLAVDVATQAMRSMIDRVGRKYGWAKDWSDAPSEWWHLRYRAGVWSGKDPGPTGSGTTTPAPAPKPPPIPELPKGTIMIQAILNHDGRLEIIVEKSNGQVWHTWQQSKGGAFVGAQAGKRRAQWFSLGNPGG